MGTISLLLNRPKKTVMTCLVLMLLWSCQSKQQSEISSSAFFCDSCEYEVITTIFNLDSLNIFYKDYSDLQRITDTFQPISGDYLRVIDTSKYIGDSSIFHHISVAAIRQYGGNILSYPAIPADQYKELAKAIVPKDKLDRLIKESKKWTFIAFSKPIFSSDGKYAVVEVNYNCFGLCGEGYTYLLKRQGRQWVLHKKILRWVS